MTLLESRSVVASWNIILPEGEFHIEFEHGTTSGKRVIWINGIVSFTDSHHHPPNDVACFDSGISSKGLDVSSSRI
jgi:hypothetical protein